MSSAFCFFFTYRRVVDKLEHHQVHSVLEKDMPVLKGERKLPAAPAGLTGSAMKSMVGSMTEPDVTSRRRSASDLSTGRASHQSAPAGQEEGGAFWARRSSGSRAGQPEAKGPLEEGRAVLCQVVSTYLHSVAFGGIRYGKSISLSFLR